MATLKRIEKIVRENAFDEKKKRPGLKFNPGLALIGLRTPGPWASDISRGRGPAKFPKKREIPRNSPEILPNTCRQNIFNTYLGY